jgi:glycosyltransferase involved in cell wall biosynthesis
MIDIFMATYNGGPYIIEQVKSIISQTYTDWLLFIHDDGSKDDTIEKIQSIQDKRIVLINDGICFGDSTKNFLHLVTNYSTSDYFCFSDQDDVWESNKLEVSLACIKQNELDKPDRPVCIGTDLKVVDSHLGVINESFYNYSKILENSDFYSLLLENSFTGCTMMMNKSVVRYLKMASVDVDSIIQHDWFVALICSSDGTAKQLEKQTVLYRQHMSNTIGAKRFSIANYVSLKSIVKYYHKITRLRVKIIKQLYLVERCIDVETNKKVINTYLESIGIKRKAFMISNRMNRSAIGVKSFVKLMFY